VRALNPPTMSNFSSSLVVLNEEGDIGAQSRVTQAGGMQEPVERWEALSDAELVAVAATEPRAFAELYRRHVQRVYHFLLVHTPAPEDAADLTQHVFLRAWESLHYYQDRGIPFHAWLIRIARNAATDMYRRSRVLTWDHLEEAFPITIGDPEAQTMRAEELNQLRIAVGRLSREKQELLALRFAAKLGAPEIAAITDRSVHAVRKQLERTIEELREQWHED